MSSAIYKKHHVDGLITSYIHRAAPSQPKPQLTEKEIDKKVEHHIFWQDRKHEREAWS